MESKRVICPVCGDDLGPRQTQSTLTGCRRCRVWVNGKGEVVKNPHKYFKQWKERQVQVLQMQNLTEKVS